MSGCNRPNSSYFPFCAVFEMVVQWREGSRSAKKQLMNLAEKDQNSFAPSR